MPSRVLCHFALRVQWTGGLVESVNVMWLGRGQIGAGEMLFVSSVETLIQKYCDGRVETPSRTGAAPVFRRTGGVSHRPAAGSISCLLHDVLSASNLAFDLLTSPAGDILSPTLEVSVASSLLDQSHHPVLTESI